jgi:GNAT superfamily N-acetyltransferase
MTATVVRIRTDEEILQTRPVMLQLRPHLAAEDYVAAVRRLMSADGFRLAAVLDETRVQAVAGYRLMEMLYCGRMLYVDDLVTDAAARSLGYGHLLLEWLKGEALSEGCAELHLDSRVDRFEAHRFYFRERLSVVGFHFATKLVSR